MPTSRANLDVETLLKIVLVLLVAWLALQIVDWFVGTLLGVLGAILAILQPVIVLVVVALIVLWLLDQL